MTLFEIISKSSEGKIRTYDIVNADFMGYTPAGFALYNEGIGEIHAMIYAVPNGCGVRRIGVGKKWDEVIIDE